MFSLISLFPRAVRSPMPAFRYESYGTNLTPEVIPPKLLSAIISCMPPLSHDKYKGQAGRIGVIGGSIEYTGAPYYAGISALKCGADLTYIITEPSAAAVIKSYSPELVVLPYLHGADAVKNSVACLPRSHSIVLGPGLGRETDTMNNVERIILEIKERGLPLVIDADGLYLITQKPHLIKGYRKAILTPNAAEFERLYNAVFLTAMSSNISEPIRYVKKLAHELQVTVMRKGLQDIVSDGTNVLVVGTDCSPRRCGGQGDLLAGFLAVFSYWAQQTVLKSSSSSTEQSKELKLYGPNMLASYAAAALTKECNKRAFSKHRRAMVASDMIAEIGPAFEHLFVRDPGGSGEFV